MKPKCDEAEFIRLFTQYGPGAVAKHLGITERNVHGRRRRIEEKTGSAIVHTPAPVVHDWATMYPKRVPIAVENGVVLIGSDAHYWPGIISAAHRGFVKLAKELQPAAVILNGDVFDGARNSRHPALGFQAKPTVRQERDAVEERTNEIILAAPKARHLWTLGNHCARFEAKLAQQVPEYEGVDGFALKDHFHGWTFAQSLWLNGDVVVKHRFKGGVHATHNNTIWSGKSMVTGHLHSLKVTPFSDYNGTRYGVDTGTLADPYGEQFEYAEDAPLNHRSGFVVLTFHRGQLLWPEVVHALDAHHVQFRGAIIEV
jgi:hypothetical protein